MRGGGGADRCWVKIYGCGLERFTLVGPTEVEEPYRLSHRYPARVLVQVTKPLLGMLQIELSWVRL